MLKPGDVEIVTQEAKDRCKKPMEHVKMRHMFLPMFCEVEPWLMFSEVLGSN